jgi:hypothetical protein
MGPLLAKGMKTGVSISDDYNYIRIILKLEVTTGKNVI